MLSFTIDIASLGKFVLALIGLIFVLFIVRAVWSFVRRLFASNRLEGMDRKAIQARWTEIERMLESGGEMHLKIAVMEADKLLDHALKAMAMPGKTLGERLKYAAYKYPKIRNVWNAHRLRNSLAHEASFYLDPGMAKRAVKDFKEALHTLHLL
ncbi:MAG: hypothetical protein QY323_01485 [Patescibacteria group bacterium]|nr:MAG: hypothetical protein QY323_01485 [Patescibacteria group bacterium]